MKNKIKIFIAPFLLIIFYNNLILAQEAKRINYVDKSFYKIEIGESHLVDVEKFYGIGGVTQMGSARCYFNDKDSAYVVFELCEDHIICGLIISIDNIWKEDCGNNSIGDSPVTGKGVELGKTFQEIIKIYGEPHSKDKENGTDILKYIINSSHEPGLGFSYISILKFKNNKLIKLSISVGP